MGNNLFLHAWGRTLLKRKLHIPGGVPGGGGGGGRGMVTSRIEPCITFTGIWAYNWGEAYNRNIIFRVQKKCFPIARG